MVIWSMVARKLRLAEKDVGVLGEEAEDEPRHEVIHFVAAVRSLPLGTLLQKLDIESIQPTRRPDVERALSDLLDGRNSRKREEEAKVIRQVRVIADQDVAAFPVPPRAPLARRSPRRTLPWLGRSPDSPSERPARPQLCASGATWMWMLLRWRTPPVSDRFVVPARRRLIVFLFPNASKKAKGNSSGSKGSSARRETASSISTAFIGHLRFALVIGGFGLSTAR